MCFQCQNDLIVERARHQPIFVKRDVPVHTFPFRPPQKYGARGKMWRGKLKKKSEKSLWDIKSKHILYYI